MVNKIFDITPPGYRKRDKKEDSVSKKRNISRLKAKAASSPKKPFKKVTGFFLFFLILFFIISQLFFSEIEIEIWPKSDVLSFEQEIVVDSAVKEIDMEGNIIPGYFSKEKASRLEQFPSTGVRESSVKAEGVIRVYNNYHISQALVVNTGFLTDGKLFRAKKRMYIPVGSYVDVKVVATKPGPDYNIKPSTFSIPGLVGYPQYTLVHGESFSEMTGGFIGETPQILEEDLSGAREDLIQRLKNETKDSLRSRFGDEYVLIDDACFYDELDYFSSAGAGDDGETFSVREEIEIGAVLFKEKDLEDFAEKFIKARIFEEEKIKENSLKIEYALKSADPRFGGEENAGQLVLTLKFSAKIYSDILNIIPERFLWGKSLDETKIFLGSRQEIEKVNIKSWPFWMKKIPYNTDKIKIDLNLD